MYIHTIRAIPTDLIVVNRLLARLPEHHERYKELEEKRYRIESGYSGELDVDRILHEVEFPRGSQILRAIKLQVNPHYLSQIDTLIISPSHAIILEIKKYSGTVYFDEEAGKTRKVSPTGQIDEFDCIIHQLIRAQDAFRQWMSQRNFNLPVVGVIVMANQRTIIPEMPTTVPVKYGKQLPRYIKEILNSPAVLSAGEINVFANEIWKHQATRTKKPACEQYKIHPGELKKGVICPKCNGMMNRKQGSKWRCIKCGDRGDRGIAQSISDWFLLVKPTITNKECRDFLSIKSNYATSVILRESRLNRQGKPPKTYYVRDKKSL